MSDYPDSIDSFRTVQNLPEVDYDEDDLKTLFAEDINSLNSAVVAIQTTLGENPEGGTTDVVNRLDFIEADVGSKEPGLGFTPENVANKSTSTSLGTSDSYYPSQKAVKTYVDAAISTLASLLYPVGSIWTSTSNSTTPATVLGFGTWSAFGEGRVLVSKAASGTFGTIGATGGAETHTLTGSEMPSHRHIAPAGNFIVFDNNNGNIGYGTSSGSNDLQGYSYTGYDGGGGAHNNLQPYIVVYMWERTA